MLFLIIAFVLLAIILRMVYGVEETLDVTSETLVGEWRTTLDLTESAQAGIDAEADEMNKYLKLKDYTFDFILTLEEDGTFSLRIDDESIDRTIENMTRQFEEALRSYYEDFIRSNKLNMTVDEMLADQNTSIEDMVAEVRDGLVPVEWIKENTSIDGFYKVQDGYLICSWDAEFSDDVSSYFSVYLTKKTMILTVLDSPDWDVWDGIFEYPLQFERES